MSHQKAAFQIITELYTPESIMQNVVLRNILKWYIHFDVFVGILSGRVAIISRDWFAKQHEWYMEHAREAPEDIDVQYEERYAWVRLTGYDLAALFTQRMQGTLSDVEFDLQARGIREAFDLFDEQTSSLLTDPSKLITEFPDASPIEPNSIVNPYEPGVIYGGDAFPTNQLILNFLGLKNMFATRMSSLTGAPRSEDAGKELAYRIVHVIDAIEHWPGAPASTLLGLRASLGMAVLFLGTSKQEIEWARKMMARVERLG
jgi:hypothetical protein